MSANGDRLLRVFRIADEQKWDDDLAPTVRAGMGLMLDATPKERVPVLMFAVAAAAMQAIVKMYGHEVTMQTVLQMLLEMRDTGTATSADASMQ